MADQTNPAEVTVTEPTPVAATTTTTNTTVEPKKSSALPKVVIILVAVICLCLLCIGAAYFLFINVINKTADAINNAVVNEMSNSTNNQSGNPSGTSETGTPDANNNDTDLDGNFSVGTDIPAGFPSDVPIYSGATASFSSSDTNEEGKLETAVTFTLNGNAADINAFYKSEMAAAGYDLTSEVNLFGNMMTFENAAREVAVSVIGTTESTDVVLTIVAMEK